MREQRHRYSTAAMSRVLKVSRSGYYAWAGRGPSLRACEDGKLKRRVEIIDKQSRGTYGDPRIHAELAADGVHVGRKRVARLMRELGVRGVSRRKWTRTTVRDPAAAVAADLVKRNFQAQGPNQLWVADITYVPTWSRFVYVAVVLDAWSRRVVGWAFAMHLRTELVSAALEIVAVSLRRSFTTPTVVVSTPRSHSAIAVGRPGCVLRWAVWETPMITRCASRSSRSWSVNGRTVSVYAPLKKLKGPSLSSSRRGILPVAVIRP